MKTFDGTAPSILPDNFEGPEGTYIETCWVDENGVTLERQGNPTAAGTYHLKITAVSQSDGSTVAEHTFDVTINKRTITIGFTDPTASIAMYVGDGLPNLSEAVTIDGLLDADQVADNYKSACGRQESSIRDAIYALSNGEKCYYQDWESLEVDPGNPYPVAIDADRLSGEIFDNCNIVLTEDAGSTTLKFDMHEITDLGLRLSDVVVPYDNRDHSISVTFPEGMSDDDKAAMTFLWEEFDEATGLWRMSWETYGDEPYPASISTVSQSRKLRAKPSHPNYKTPDDYYLKADFAITRLPVTIKPQAYSKRYGEDDPSSFEYTIELPQGSVRRDLREELDAVEHSVALTRDEGDEIGTYQIKPSADSPTQTDNLSITYEPAVFTIGQGDSSKLKPIANLEQVYPYDRFSHDLIVEFQDLRTLADDAATDVKFSTRTHDLTMGPGGWSAWSDWKDYDPSNPISIRNSNDSREIRFWVTNPKYGEYITPERRDYNGDGPIYFSIEPSNQIIRLDGVEQSADGDTVVTVTDKDGSFKISGYAELENFLPASVPGSEVIFGKGDYSDAIDVRRDGLVTVNKYGKSIVMAIAPLDAENGNWTYTSRTIYVTVQRTADGEHGLGLSLEPTSEVYDGNPHSVQVRLSDELSEEERNATVVEYATSTDGGETWSDWSTDEPQATHVADSRLVKARASNPSFVGYSESNTTKLEITRKPARVLVSNSSKVYAPTPNPDPDFKTLMSLDGVMAGDENLILDATTATREPGEQAGDYRVTVSGPKEIGDYTVEYDDSVWLIIERASNEFLQPTYGQYSFEYDGEPHELQVTIPTLEKDTDEASKEVFYFEEDRGDFDYYGYNGEKNLGNAVAKISPITNASDSHLVTVDVFSEPNYDSYITPDGEWVDFKITPTTQEIELLGTDNDVLWYSDNPQWIGLYDSYDNQKEFNLLARAHLSSNPDKAGSPVQFRLSDDSPTDVIDVTSDGHVTVKKHGTVIVEVTAEATENWYETEEYYYIEVLRDVNGPDGLSLTPGQSTFVYDGTPHTPTFTLSDNLTDEEAAATKIEYAIIPEDADPDARYDDYDWSEDAPSVTNVDDTCVVIARASNDGFLGTVYTNKVTLEVTPAPASAMNLQVQDYQAAYDGADHELVVTHDAAGGTTTLSYKVDGGEWSEDAPSFKNVGTHTVQVKASNSNYETAEVTAKVTIEPKDITVTPVKVEKTVYEDDPTYTWTVDGMVDGESSTLISAKVTREPGEAPGTYALTTSGEDVQGNYRVSYEKAPAGFTIKRADIATVDADVTLVAPQSEVPYRASAYEAKVIPQFKGAKDATITYSGTVTAPAGNAGSASRNNSPAANGRRKAPTSNTRPISGEGALEALDAGTYDVEFTVTHPYYDGAITRRAHFTITPLPVNLTCNDVTVAYGDKLPDFTYEGTYTTPSGANAAKIDSEITAIIKQNSSGSVKVRTYADGVAKPDMYPFFYIWNDSEKNSNYVFTFPEDKMRILTVGQAPLDKIAEDGRLELAFDDPTPVTYDGEQHEKSVLDPVDTLSSSDGSSTSKVTLKEGVDYTVSYSRAEGDFANSGEIVATFTGMGKYSGTTTVSYTIKKADAAKLKPSVGKTYFSYDGMSHALQVSLPQLATPEDDAATTVSYSIDGGKTWTTTVPTLKNAGSNVKVLLRVESPNYETYVTPANEAITLEVAAVPSPSTSNPSTPDASKKALQVKKPLAATGDPLAATAGAGVLATAGAFLTALAARLRRKTDDE